MKLVVTSLTVTLAKELSSFSSTVTEKDGKAIGGYESKFAELPLGSMISEGLATERLTEELNRTADLVRSLVYVPISPGQFDAMILLARDIGAYSFRRSKLLKCLNAADPVAAATQFDSWKWADKLVVKDGKSKKVRHKPPHLVRKRNQQARIFCNFPLL